MSNDNEKGKDDDKDDRGRATVTIVVDDVKHEVKPGQWVVRDLKKKTGVDPAKVLAEITPHGLVDLDDDAKIGVHEKQRFMSHARSGGSS
ncbi:hypothetical protein [Sphingopyxis terrae]|uniref:hypothetical protein n=1 Tax=Sphingopyxis terrae TaxID=33052 RepID=UPI001C2C9356|nr:hypothetical protein [Sphingopyxis terrae]QXF11102.1 hypothetical protein HBA51_02210 [Sphingopyxis terrae subsp. terrae]